MIVTAAKAVAVILLGFLFAYIYGFIEHGFIPAAEHLRLRFFHHFANYHVIMFCLFSALPLSVLVFEPNLLGLCLSFGVWIFIPLGEDISWYHFAGTWPTPQDWTSWGGGYYIAGHWVPRWYLVNSILATMLFILAMALSLSR